MSTKHPRWPAIRAFIEANGGQATSTQVCKATGISQKITTTLLAQYVKAGRLYRGGDAGAYRYFLAAEDASKVQSRGYVDRRGTTAEALRLLQEAGEQGTTRIAIAEAIGCTIGEIEHSLCMLRKRGQVFGARYNNYVQQFARLEWAEAFLQRRSDDLSQAKAEQRRKWRESKQRQRIEAVKTAKQKPEPVPGKKLVKPSRFVPLPPKPVGPVIIPENVKRTFAPIKPGRYDVTGPVVGGWATMKPGQYLPSESVISRVYA